MMIKTLNLTLDLSGMYTNIYYGNDYIHIIVYIYCE